jgi:hypothetical protein
MYTLFWLQNLKGRDHLEVLGVDGKIILEWIVGKCGGKMWSGCIWLRTGTSGEFSEHGNEPSGSIKEGNFLTR